MLYRLGEWEPEVAEGVWIAPDAQVVGRVQVAEEASIWFNTVLRGDTDRIVVGRGTNVQDGTVIHCDPGYPALIGENVTIGHSCVIHGCQIGDETLIGMGSVILTGAKIGSRCLVAAGSLITEHQEFPDGSVIMGRPAKVVRPVGEKELAMIRRGAEVYRRNGRRYMEELQPLTRQR
ncbi:MAG TPA: gamma carbonic anhydrase family protein [Symbiobacteriaceae bacterium]